MNQPFVMTGQQSMPSQQTKIRRKIDSEKLITKLFT